MNKGVRLQYPSSIEQIVEKNESFDSCIIKICYAGKNRNKSSISKHVIEDALPSIYNCPIVCNYNVRDDTIGGHDVDIVSTNNGMRLINLTDAIGVIPFNCNYYWETIIDDGVEHEYLCVEAILWKRSAAYYKIKKDGIVSQSMEITVKDGKTVDDFYEIDKFVFTAFCLLGDDIEPCFESASLEMFSLQQLKNTFDAMMADFKEHFSKVATSKEDDINPQNIMLNISKGGNFSLDRMELLSEYGLTAESLDFNIDDFTVDELRVMFEDMKKKSKTIDDDDPEASLSVPEGGNNEVDTGDIPDADSETSPNEDSESVDEEESEEFSLTGEQFLSQLYEALSLAKYTDPNWGEMCKYAYVDFDHETFEVYCYDCEDWKLYGFSYSMNGDNVVINFDSKKRKKFSIVDFDEGGADFNYRHAFEMYGKAISASKDAELSRLLSESEEKYNQAFQTIDSLQAELTDLKQYKETKLCEERKDAEEMLFARFAELDGVEAFDSLRTNCAEMTIEDIESKCFEIKGRNATVNFSSIKPKSTRIAVEKKYENEPYGGLFVQYPPANN